MKGIRDPAARARQGAQNAEMKLIRFGEPNKERPGVLWNGRARLDVSGLVSDFNEEFFETGGLVRLRQWLDREAQSAPQVDASVRLGPPVARPSKIVCVGLNFRDHAAESKMALPPEPVLFMKSTSALAGPNDPVIIPKGADKLDWEVELAVVIEKKVSHIRKEDALGSVAGFTLHNDYSERAFQFERGGQWVKGKSADTFAPLGPFLATPDEIDDIGNLQMWLTVNGQPRQKSTTANMIFGVAELISYISQFMTLFPGDIISTGTPAGVAFGMHAPQYLRPGDVVELGIAGLGTARQEVIAFTT